MARHEPTAQLESAALQPRAKVDDFPAVVALLREAREARLVYALEHWVHLVKFERGRIELDEGDAAAPT